MTSSAGSTITRHLKLIALETAQATQGDVDRGLQRRQEALQWTLAASGADALTGAWNGGGKSLPIRLSRVALAKVIDDDDDSVSCGNLAFTAPRLTPPMVSRAPASLDGVSYTKLTVHTAPRSR